METKINEAEVNEVLQDDQTSCEINSKLTPMSIPEKEFENQDIKSFMEYAKIFVQSGMFPDMRSLSVATTKMIAGKELGLTPFASVRGLNIIQGRPELNAGVLGHLIKSSDRYDYIINEWNDKHCIIDFYDLKNWGKKSIGQSSFNEDDAKKAGLLYKDNWKKYPKAMMFARALSQGARTYCPDTFNGAIYTEGEISGANIEGVDLPTPEKPKVEIKAGEAVNVLDTKLKESNEN